MSNSDNHKLESPEFSQVFSAPYNTRQRGVFILIHRNISLTHTSTITDPDGRYIILNALIYNTSLTIANIYGPNTDDPPFFHRFFTSLSNFTDSKIIIRGDFNTVLNPAIDRSGITSRRWHSTETIKQYMEEVGLDDSWRLHNPTAKIFSYYSPLHHSFSHIDYFLTSKSIIKDITETSIHSIVISDHAPITLYLHSNQFYKQPPRWRFNLSLLKDPDFDRFLRREWASFIDINDTPNISPALIWETAKIVIQGKIISYSSYKKKKETAHETKLELKIKELENTYAIDPTDGNLNKLRKYKLDTVFNTAA